jgi:D-glucuronyl C5-epimerase C-terminus
MARSRRLIASRMPVMFLELQRNTQYWRRLPFPGSRDDVTFRGSEILFRYFPGEGLQVHPLSTFKKANLMHGACVGAVSAPCRRQGLARLLDEMTRIAVRRTRRFIAWEYEFTFGGGSPPWMSGMAQASGIQALARGSQLLGRPGYLRTAQKALGAYETPPPVGVRTRGFRGGVHYLQYSFARRTYIFNAFTQALIGLYDYSRISGDQRALRLFQDAEPELGREVPFSDLGDWSMYSYRGEVSDPSYHELLREVLQSMCSRGLGAVYCNYARRYRDYQTAPPALQFLGPGTASPGQVTRLSFDLSKLSAVEITVTKGDSVAFHKIATFYRGAHSFTWTPHSSGTYAVQLSAKEKRTGMGLKGRTSGTVEVGN